MTKIHAHVDVLGRPLRLVLTPDNSSDGIGAYRLIGEPVGMKRVIADHGYGVNRIRVALRDQRTIPVIPGRRNRKRPIQYDERRYKDRWRVEAMFCRIEDFRRVATRYDQLPISRKPRSLAPLHSGSERVSTLANTLGEWLRKLMSLCVIDVAQKCSSSESGA